MKNTKIVGYYSHITHDFYPSKDEKVGAELTFMAKAMTTKKLPNPKSHGRILRRGE